MANKKCIFGERGLIGPFNSLLTIAIVHNNFLVLWRSHDLPPSGGWRTRRRIPQVTILRRSSSSRHPSNREHQKTPYNIFAFCCLSLLLLRFTSFSLLGSTTQVTQKPPYKLPAGWPQPNHNNNNNIFHRTVSHRRTTSYILCGGYISPPPPSIPPSSSTYYYYYLYTHLSSLFDLTLSTISIQVSIYLVE